MKSYTPPTPPASVRVNGTSSSVGVRHASLPASACCPDSIRPPFDWLASPAFWFKGMSTKGWVDGRPPKFTEGQIFKATGTKRYESRGGQRTVFLIEAYDPPGKPAAVRVAHWPSITVPCLFLEGTVDPFCNLDLLREHLPSLGGPATLHVVEGGDHSLQVRSSSSPDGRPRSPARVMAELAPVVSSWLESVAVRS